MSTDKKPAVDYTFFNKFQTYFYTNIAEFSKFTNYEIKQNAFVLVNNIAKGLPTLSTEISNVYCKGFINFQECPSLILALQRKFVNGFSRARIPQSIFYKTPKVTKLKAVAAKQDKSLLDFDDSIAFQIKSVLFIDEKTYQYFKYSDKIQRMGKHYLEEFEKSEIEKIKKSTSRKKSI